MTLLLATFRVYRIRNNMGEGQQADTIQLNSTKHMKHAILHPILSLSLIKNSLAYMFYISLCLNSTSSTSIFS